MSDIESRISHYEGLIELTKEDNYNLNSELRSWVSKLEIIDNYKLLKERVSKKVFIILSSITVILFCFPGVSILGTITVNLVLGLLIPKIKLRKERKIYKQYNRIDVVEKIEYLREEIESNNKSINILNNGIDNLKIKTDSSEPRVVFEEEPLTKQKRLALGNIS